MITEYEAKLIAHVIRELDPDHCVTSLSMKTDPLSDDCREELRMLLERRGYRVEFPVEEILGHQQSFIRAFAVTTG